MQRATRHVSWRGSSYSAASKCTFLGAWFKSVVDYLNVLFNDVFSFVKIMLYSVGGVWIIAGMSLTAKRRRTVTATCPNASLSTTNPRGDDLGSNPVLRGERPARLTF